MEEYGLRLALFGGIVGVLLGAGALRLMRGMLFGGSGFLPLALAVAVVLLLVTLAACAIPALRATRIAPQAALRAD